MRVQRLHHRRRTLGTHNQDPEKHDERSQGTLFIIIMGPTQAGKVCVIIIIIIIIVGNNLGNCGVFKGFAQSA